MKRVIDVERDWVAMVGGCEWITNNKKRKAKNNGIKNINSFIKNIGIEWFFMTYIYICVCVYVYVYVYVIPLRLGTW